MGGRLTKVLLILAAAAVLAAPASGIRAHRSPPLAVPAPAAEVRLAAHDRAGDDVCGRRWA